MYEKSGITLKTKTKTNFYFRFGKLLAARMQGTAIYTRFNTHAYSGIIRSKIRIYSWQNTNNNRKEKKKSMNANDTLVSAHLSSANYIFTVSLHQHVPEPLIPTSHWP